MESVIIAARARNGVIGKDGKLPWHFSEDLRRFKALTLGNIVVMGRSTFESIGSKPLPGRINIILTTHLGYGYSGLITVNSIEQALEFGNQRSKDIFFAGGARVYEEALPFANRLELTEICADYEGDVYFPTLNLQEWQEVNREPRAEYDFVTYVRNR